MSDGLSNCVSSAISYETTVRTLSLEVEVAVREMETSCNETQAQARAVKAGKTQLDYLEKRWELLPGDGGNAALMLDNLLTAQERLTRSEGLICKRGCRTTSR